MFDYKELYLKMVRASEKAINEIVAAQQECEEKYIELSEAAQENTSSEANQ